MSDLPPPSEPSPLAPSPFSPALAVTGLLMLLTMFATANPMFGTAHKVWPWEMLAQGHHSSLVEAVFLLWTAAAFWCLAMAFTKAASVRAVGAAMLGAPLLIEACGGLGGLTIEHVSLSGMIPMILLAGGLLVAREPSTRATGACIAGTGSLLLLWALATGFPPKSADPKLLVWWNEFTTALGDPSHEFERVNHLWWDVVPQTLILVGALGGLLALLGVRSRGFLTVVFWIAAAGVFFPGGVGIVLQLQAGSGVTTVLREVIGVFVAHGALLWMLGAFTIQDLGKVRAQAEAA